MGINREDSDIIKMADSINIRDRYSTLCGVILGLNEQRIKTNSKGEEYFAILPKEFKKYCRMLKHPVDVFRMALKRGGYLYLERNSENTRNCKIDGKQYRCLCIYKDRF